MPVKKKGLKVSRERCGLKILPTDGARACNPISLDRRQLLVGMLREEGQIVDCVNMKERLVTFEYQE